MASLDTVSIAILLGALLVLAGILSSLVAMRFGAPLLLVFLLVGIVAGEAGFGIKFDDVETAYTVGSIALALILFDGGLRTRFQTFRNVIGPAGMLATVGVLLTAAVTAPAAYYALGLGWTEALLVGAVIASTDAAAVFFLLHTRGLRLRPRVNATLEVESGLNDPAAIFLTLVLIELLLHGNKPWEQVALLLARDASLGTLFGILGGRAVVWVLNRLDLTWLHLFIKLANKRPTKIDVRVDRGVSREGKSLPGNLLFPFGLELSDYGVHGRSASSLLDRPIEGCNCGVQRSPEREAGRREFRHRTHHVLEVELPWTDQIGLNLRLGDSQHGRPTACGSLFLNHRDLLAGAG